MTFGELCRTLGADLLPPQRWDDRPACVECGCGCDPIRPNVPSVCVDCSTHPLGETWPGLAHRVSHDVRLSAWSKMETIEDVPPLRYKAWRVKHFGR